MKAMILAAGLGTRLGSLTADRPKALVKISGRTLLEIALARLSSLGIRDVIINVHHFADMVVEYLAAKNNFGLRIEISRENELLDTGGGLKKAAWFFLQDAATADQPFLLHNVDVLSTIDIRQMVQFHGEQHALATLAVQHRESSRLLLFDEQLYLCGREFKRNPRVEMVRNSPNPQPFGFTGIHIISPRFLSLLTENGPFSIIDSYLSAAAQGENISAFQSDQYYWRDLGRPADLIQASTDIQQNIFSQ